MVGTRTLNREDSPMPKKKTDHKISRSLNVGIVPQTHQERRVLRIKKENIHATQNLEDMKSWARKRRLRRQ